MRTLLALTTAGLLAVSAPVFAQSAGSPGATGTGGGLTGSNTGTGGNGYRDWNNNFGGNNFDHGPNAYRNGPDNADGSYYEGRAAAPDDGGYYGAPGINPNRGYEPELPSTPRQFNQGFSQPGNGGMLNDQ